MIVDQLGDKPSAERIQDVVRQVLAVELTDAEAAMVANDTLHPYSYSSAYVHRWLGNLPARRLGQPDAHRVAAAALRQRSGARQIGGLMHNTEVFW